MLDDADDDAAAIDLFAEEETATATKKETWREVSQLASNKIRIELGAKWAVWGSSLNMAKYIADTPALVLGKDVIELGAGMGLPSFVAAKIGAKHCLITDVDKHCVEALPAAIQHNKLAGIVEAQTLDWFAYLRPGPPPAKLSKVPVLLAADCNYTTTAVPALIAVIDALLEPDGVLLLASREERIGLNECLGRLQSSVDGGLQLTLERVVTFSEDSASWTTVDVADGAGSSRSSSSSSSSSINAEPADDDPMAGAAHRMWFFRRPAAVDVADPSSSSASASSSSSSSAAAAIAALDASSLYFERQVLMRCGRHAINNMLGKAAFTTSDLDDIAISIAGNLTLHHRWPVLGNYDANVILLALQKRGLEGSFWDGRRNEDELRKELKAPAVVGALLNVKSRPRFLGGVMPIGRHWLALRKLQGGGAWADVDSELTAPKLLHGEDALLERLRAALAENEGHLIIVKAYFAQTVR